MSESILRDISYLKIGSIACIVLVFLFYKEILIFTFGFIAALIFSGANLDDAKKFKDIIEKGIEKYYEDELMSKLQDESKPSPFDDNAFNDSKCGYQEYLKRRQKPKDRVIIIDPSNPHRDATEGLPQDETEDAAKKILIKSSNASKEIENEVE
jgi:hypothetical protein